MASLIEILGTFSIVWGFLVVVLFFDWVYSVYTHFRG